MSEIPDDLAEEAAALIEAAERYLAACSGTSNATVKRSHWEARLFERMSGLNASLATTVRAFGDDVDYSNDLLADVFALLWLSRPELLSREDVSPTRWDNLKVLRAMSRSEDVALLRAATVHDDLASATAVVWLAEAIRKWLREAEPVSDAEAVAAALEAVQEAMDDMENAQEPQPGGDGGDEGAQDPLSNALADLADALADADADVNLDGLGEAARDAGSELAQVAALGAMVGLSSRGASRGEGATMSTAQTWALLQRLSALGIKQYAEMIGRFMSTVSKGVTRSPTPRGVELSDRVAEADAGELATRAHRLLRLEHLARVASGELITDSYTVTEEREGPMVLVVDESQSMAMRGKGGVSRWLWSKAFVLAIAQRARKAGRPFVIISFADEEQVRVWDNPDAADLVSYLEHFFRGGTTYEDALDAALTVVETTPGLGRADIVLITDDDRPDVPGGWLTRWRQRRDAVKPVPPRLRGVGVAVQPGTWLTTVADDVVMVTDFTSEEQVARAARAF